MAAAALVLLLSSPERARAMIDGMAVRVDADTVYEPDALVRCGERLGPNVVEVVDPVILVEVISPSTHKVDTTQKLGDYFRIPSVRHYLIVNASRRTVVHHERLARRLGGRDRERAGAATDLHERLQKLGVSNLVLAGFMTHMCVNSTARGAFNLGYRPTVVAAATATRSLPTPQGGIVHAEALQEASLATLSDLFAVIVSNAAALPE